MLRVSPDGVVLQDNPDGVVFWVSLDGEALQVHPYEVIGVVLQGSPKYEFIQTGSGTPGQSGRRVNPERSSV